jgi:thiamine biosynthesis lipoprotein
MNKIAILILSLIFIVSCGTKEKIKVEHREFIFGTMINFTVYGEKEKEIEEAIEYAVVEMKRIESAYNTKNKGSILYNLNLNPIKEQKMTDELYDILMETRKVSEFSKGYFDITIGPLVDLWGFDKLELKEIPNREEIEKVLDLIDYKSLIFDKNNIKLSCEGQKLETGSFLKGYAIKRAKEVLIEHNIESALISAISSVETIGFRGDGGKWRVGVQNPKNPDEMIKIANLSGEAMGVSGDYQTYVVVDGKKYHHILNPKTGYPGDTISMLVVITSDSFFADLYSTALFMESPEKIIETVEKMEGTEVMVVDKEDNIYLSSDMKKYLSE